MITIKALSLAATGGGWMDLEFSKNIVLENCHYLTYLAVPLEPSFIGLFCIWPDWEFTHCKNLFLWRLLSKTFRYSFLTL